ncbi:MAG: hemolysin III family protein [Kofleriaceae bacterium]
MTAAPLAQARPRLRGVFHQVAAPLTLGVGLLLIQGAATARGAWAVAVFVASLVVMFTISAVYHRVTWRPAARARMRRADHAAIFVLIAGSATPFALLTLPPAAAERALLIAWIGAAIGIGKALLWVTAPRWVGTGISFALGWALVTQFGPAADVLSRGQIACVFAGGAAYTLGGVAYAVGRPNPWPGVLGYHEVFHVLTLVAAGLHLAVVAQLAA